ncbi:MAG: AmmeMemoRadiSam system protein B [Halodesulfurarchaeum sp.]|nr:AmmeMemoRadiSam system protein B [Halodesulfurarchaeum sp.]
MSTHRSPAVAGQFYAGTEAGLREQIESAFEHPMGPGSVPVVEPTVGLPIAIISPHAGYPYSGPIAAHGFARMAAGGRPEAVVILGPNHGRGGAPLAISDADRWETPLGSVPIHDEIRSSLATAPGLELDERTHDGEHSLEVQVPFLQYLYDDVPIVPVLMSRQDESRVTQAVSALTEVFSSDRNVVLIASTDLTHYEPHEVAKRDDEPIRRAIQDLDADGIMEAARSGHTMCGFGPTAAILRASHESGGTEGSVHAYATSGDTAGGTDSVVGYVSAAVT